MFMVLYTYAYAEENYFYLGDKVPDIHIIMDKNGKKVYRQFRMIYSKKNDELVYCIEPGAVLSLENYLDFDQYNAVFNISDEAFEKIKLIGYFGYKYNNHLDIKWYAITQYLIWKETMPENWDVYFVDENKNRIDNMFENEINEIINLINNYKNKPAINDNYYFNINEDIEIVDDNNLIDKYSSNFSNLNIMNNKIHINKFNEPGKYDVSLNYINYVKPMFFYHSTGQNIFVSGSVYQDNLNFKLEITSGKVNVNECDQDTFLSSFNGGEYEVLDQDDEVIDTFKCDNNECISNYLPVGNLKIRVKNLSDDFEKNEHIYDVEVLNNEVSNINICSLKKKIEIPVEDIPLDDTDIEKEIIEKFNTNSDEVIIDIPYTFKNDYIIYLFFIALIILEILIIRYE